MNRGFYSIMCAQFLSSLADNALLIAAIALLTQMNAPDWMTPLLKLFFVVSYICLAAYVGLFADSMPKGRVMFLTNMLKVGGCLLMLFGSHPLLAYAVVGIGAAAYSPAKYGILTELLPPVKLVLANSWIEGLTVASIILGVVLGGVLINDAVSYAILHCGFPFEALGIATPAQAAISIIVFIYLAAAAVNLLIPDTGARYPKADFRPIETLKTFYKSCAILWKDRLGQISLSVTTLFWGAGAVLQFLVLKWAEYALGMNLSEGAILQAVVSVGIAVGAVARFLVQKMFLGDLLGPSTSIPVYDETWSQAASHVLSRNPVYNLGGILCIVGTVILVAGIVLTILLYRRSRRK